MNRLFFYLRVCFFDYFICTKLVLIRKYRTIMKNGSHLEGIQTEIFIIYFYYPPFYIFGAIPEGAIEIKEVIVIAYPPVGGQKNDKCISGIRRL